MDININVIIIVLIILLVLFLLYRYSKNRNKSQIPSQIPQKNIYIQEISETPVYYNDNYYNSYGNRKSSFLNKSRNRRRLKVRFNE